jgi:predicted nuclease with TOPRIM domain
MRKVLLILSLLALTGLYGCNGQDEELKEEIKELEAKIESQKKDISTKESDLDEASTTIINLRDEMATLREAKELGAVEITNLKWVEKDADFKLILKGTVKNTSSVYLRDVSIKVGIEDKTENIIEAKVVNDPDRESMKMLFFHNVADSMNAGDSKDFEMVIYTRNIFAAGLGKVKEAIRTMADLESSQVKITGLFITAK